MIELIVVSVARRQSSQVNTIHLSYEEGKSKPTHHQGAVWEEVEFACKEETQPVISVGNVYGDAFLVGQPLKLIINNPKLFGTFKVGDIVPFAPLLIQPGQKEDN